MKSLTLGQDRGREPLRTMAEIESRIGRGGLTDGEIDRLWECLCLTGDELRESLESIKAHATARFVYPMVSFISLTGFRRAEMLRSRIDDIDLDEGIVHIRSAWLGDEDALATHLATRPGHPYARPKTRMVA